jgi:ubiquinone/menaquinone biosynthesis C-methylase UbiE
MSEAPTADLPDYAPMLAAYHRGFARQLRRMIAALPIRTGMRVLDMACGDGAYTVWLAERVGPTGEVVAVDIDPAFLARAKESAAASNIAAPVLHVAAPLEALPFEPATFDVIWCAQSLYSLPDPLETLRTLRPLLRPGGHLAVLENDTLHHLLLPWPVEIEIALRAHEYRALAEESGHPRKYYAARELARLFRSAGYADVRFRTYATDLRGPLAGDVRTFVAEYLRDLGDRVGPRLDPATRRDLERLVDPASEDYLLDDPDFLATCLDRVVFGAAPERTA